MKNLVIGVALFCLGGLAAALWIGVPLAPTEVTEAAELYTCGMHPQVLQEGPGTCPICNMNLTRQSRETVTESTGDCTAEDAIYWRAPMDPSFVSDRPGKSPMGMDLVPVCDVDGGGVVPVDPTVIQTMGVRTGFVERGQLSRTIRTVARVEADERKKSIVTSKVSGWIEQLLVDETGTLVRKGQPLFTLYSPALVSGQEEYLLAVRQGNRRLIESARRRLRYWDVSDAQLDQIKKAGKPTRAVTVFADSTGHIVHKQAIEGMRVETGAKLYEIVDLDHVWVQADVFEYEVPWIEPGQKAELSLAGSPGRIFTGTVSYVYPFLDEASRTVRVRIEFSNPELVMKPGMVGTVRIESVRAEETLTVATEAVIQTGQRSVAFVALGSGRFALREVETGIVGDDGRTQVLSGLEVGERVVVSGQFLLDSESQLREAVAKLTNGNGPATRPATRPAGGR